MQKGKCTSWFNSIYFKYYLQSYKHKIKITTNTYYILILQYPIILQYNNLVYTIFLINIHCILSTLLHEILATL